MELGILIKIWILLLSKDLDCLKDGSRRSDVQSVTSLIRRGNDFEVINIRRDVSPAGEWEDVFFIPRQPYIFTKGIPL